MKNSKGISIISFILTILILILIAFLGYEVFYVEIFDINEEILVSEEENKTNKIHTNYQNNIENTENISIIEPIIDDNNFLGSTQELSSYKYYYKQLDEYGKIIYNGFDDNKENMKSGTYVIDFGKDFNELLKLDDGTEKLNIAFQSAWNAYTYDNIDVFYIDVEKLILTTKTTSVLGFETHTVELSNGNNASYLKDNFSHKSIIDEKLNYVDKIRKEIKRQLEGYSDFEKIKQVHDFLIENVEYDVNLLADEPYSILGPLTEGKAVCEGYARTFKYIMDELEIPCILVSGEGTNSKGETESHAWNYVELNGNWYAIDVTWDDPVIIGNGTLNDETKYKNFLKGSNTFFNNHVEDGYLSDNSIKFEFPKLSENNY